MSINPGAIGAKLDQQALLKAAVQYGFEAIVAMPSQLAEMNDRQLDAFLSEMKSKGISWGSAGLPLDFRKSETKFREGLKNNKFLVMPAGDP